ncbi:MAG TPA: 3-mercaptopyruvate sulfurtransferase [Caulobacteraceae bacterium]|nr:3-mercaptopyruvate sulfurtransferase [Caulobacteraceae bacterium]
MPDDPLVSTEWLHEHLGDTRVKVLDGSWFLPGDPRDPKAAFLEAHIPGAQFFDIDEISDKTSALPHMAPSPEQFAFQVGELGIGGEDTVVVYDQAGLFSAPRVWWSFRLFGHGKAFVLDGGLPVWTQEGRPLEHGAPAPPPAGDFAVLTAHPELVRNLDQVWRALEQHSEQVVDVRSAERFRGAAPEPRPGLRAGHMPGAINLPIAELMDAEGRLKPAPALAKAFEAAGVDLNGAIVTSCGSGIAASLAALGLARLNHWNAAVYDGSWTEWGAHAAAPVVTGP